MVARVECTSKRHGLQRPQQWHPSVLCKAIPGRIVSSGTARAPIKRARADPNGAITNELFFSTSSLRNVSPLAACSRYYCFAPHVLWCNPKNPKNHQRTVLGHKRQRPNTLISRLYEPFTCSLNAYEHEQGQCCARVVRTTPCVVLRAGKINP